jgi:hypothetical protein
MEHTKGYFSLKGKIWALNNKEPKENSATKFLSFGLQTEKDNSIFLQLGEWKNTTLNVKMKGSDSTETEEINEQDAIDRLQKSFKDGDSVYINARSQVDTYRKSLKYLVNQIYIEKEPIDFDTEDFEEVNSLNQTVVVIEKPKDRKVKVGVTTYKGEMIEQELSLSDDDVNDYFEENVKVGDVLKLTISVKRKPNYVEQGESTERKTLKGKTVKTGGKKIDKDNPYTESLEVVDVDIEKTEKQKYDRNSIREALELAEQKEEKVTNIAKDVEQPVSTDDLPF